MELDLTPSEMRLIQAFRTVSPKLQGILLLFVSNQAAKRAPQKPALRLVVTGRAQ
jgi:hypothetical protein